MEIIPNASNRMTEIFLFPKQHLEYPNHSGCVVCVKDWKKSEDNELACFLSFLTLQSWNYIFNNQTN